jgi:hypothetical protein
MRCGITVGFVSSILNCTEEDQDYFFFLPYFSFISKEKEVFFLKRNIILTLDVPHRGFVPSPRLLFARV